MEKVHLKCTEYLQDRKLKHATYIYIFFLQFPLPPPPKKKKKKKKKL